MSLLCFYSDEVEEEKEKAEKLAGTSDKDDEALISASGSKLILVLISCVRSSCGSSTQGILHSRFLYSSLAQPRFHPLTYSRLMIAE